LYCEVSREVFNSRQVWTLLEPPLILEELAYFVSQASEQKKGLAFIWSCCKVLEDLRRQKSKWRSLEIFAICIIGVYKILDSFSESGEL